MNSEQDSNQVKLYLKDFSSQETESSLLQFFSDYNENIVGIVIEAKNSQHTYSSNVGAIITFNDKNVAEKAMKALNLRKLNNKSIRIMRNLQDNTSRYNSLSNLFVKNIPENVEPRQFYEYFLKFGDISSARLNENEAGRHYGYGYVDFSKIEDAQRAIENSDGKEIWKGKVLEVKNFIHKNERPVTGTEAKTIIVKNFPNLYTEENIRDLFENFGKIKDIKIFVSHMNGKKFSILTFDSENSAHIAIERMNKNEVEGKELECSFVEKREKKNHFINSDQSKTCNLHVKNIPCMVKEKELYENFAVYGTIKSLKISKDVKIENSEKGLVKREISKEFGYICFENPDSARNAYLYKNGGYLKNWEFWKRPLVINYFISRSERQKQMYQQKQNDYNQGMQYPKINQYYPNINPNPYVYQYPSQMPNVPMMYNNMNMPSPYNYGYQNEDLSNSMMNMNIGNSRTSNKYSGSHQKTRDPWSDQNKFDKSKNRVQEDYSQNQEDSKNNFDIQYYQSLEESDKQEYLGEILYKLIEDYLSRERINCDIHTTGKITGMILGIQDKEEILETISNKNLIESRINEAIELIKSTNQ